MKIVETAPAPNPRRVRIFLAEKGIDMTYEQVDLGAMEHRSEKFAALNPFQRVPVLVLDDGTCISESVAICRYFEELHPEPPLMGSDALDKARVEMWQRHMEIDLLQHVAQTFRHLHPGMKEREVPQVAEWGEANRPRAQETLRFLDRELAGREFVAGDSFSIADITAFVAVNFMKPARIERPADLTNLSRWFEAVSARPSAAA